MDRQPDFHKAAGILIRDRKILVAREKDRLHFLAPGGVIETGETPLQTLVRELIEEVNIKVNESQLEEFGTFWAEAAGKKDKWVKMEVFLVKNWSGEPAPTSGEEVIEEIMWLTSQIPPNILVGSIFAHEVIPRLQAMDIID